MIGASYMTMNNEFYKVINEEISARITSDNYHVGAIAGEYFLEQCKEAELLIMTHETTKSVQDRIYFWAFLALPAWPLARHVPLS